MTDARKTPEDEVLQHFRVHSTEEPSTSLDAFILATARREVSAPKPNFWQRWVQVCQKPRWQVAFASLVGVALMLAVVPRPSEQQMSDDFAPKMSAPVAKKEAVQAPSSVARSLAAPAQRESTHIEMADEAKASKRATVPVQSLDDQLREVLRLQNAGQTHAADQLIGTLHKHYPKENLTTRLKELKKN